MILINGEQKQAIDATDRGLQYGDGLFETIAIRRGEPELWQQHIERLFAGCRRLAIPLPDAAQLFAEASVLCEGVEQGVMKLVVTRGSGGRGYRPPSVVSPNRIFYLHPWPEHADDTTPIHLRLCQTPLSCNPVLAGIKHLNRLEQVLARSEWDDERFAEGVMTDGNGHLIEGTMSNLFVVRAGELLTPSLARCGVEGVMRQYVIELADAMGLDCRQAMLPLGVMERVEECFITNSIIGIRAVAQFEKKGFDDNPITRHLQLALNESLER